jgi:hypothetical protein
MNENMLHRLRLWQGYIKRLREQNPDGVPFRVADRPRSSTTPNERTINEVLAIFHPAIVFNRSLFTYECYNYSLHIY